MWTEDVSFVETQRQSNHEEFYDNVAVLALLQRGCRFGGVLVEFMYPVFTRMPGESYRR